MADRKVYSPGKLMLSGEYLVLDGALSFALPTKFGQSLEMKVSPREGDDWIHWTALDHNGEEWLNAQCRSVPEMEDAAENEGPSQKLMQLLLWVFENSKDLRLENEYHFTSKLDFPPYWGLGSSSTLVANLSKMFGLDAFEMAADTIGGSCYDVAIGLESSPLTYCLSDPPDPRSRMYQKVKWTPVFASELFFVHLNEKMVTDSAVKEYRKRFKPDLTHIQEVTDLSNRLIGAASLSEFEAILLALEAFMSTVLGRPTIKEERFSDYPGVVKSLGSWGGDFLLATGSEEQAEHYFKGKGYHAILSFEEMILK